MQPGADGIGAGFEDAGAVGGNADRAAGCEVSAGVRVGVLPAEGGRQLQRPVAVGACPGRVSGQRLCARWDRSVGKAGPAFKLEPDGGGCGVPCEIRRAAYFEFASNNTCSLRFFCVVTAQRSQHFLGGGRATRYPVERERRISRVPFRARQLGTAACRTRRLWKAAAALKPLKP